MHPTNPCCRYGFCGSDCQVSVSLADILGGLVNTQSTNTRRGSVRFGSQAAQKPRK